MKLTQLKNTEIYPSPDRQTDGQTDRYIDIGVDRMRGRWIYRYIKLTENCFSQRRPVILT